MKIDTNNLKKSHISKIQDKKIALLLIAENEEYAVFLGIAKLIENKLYFVREEKVNLMIPDEVHHRIKPVPKEEKDIFLNADYYISLTVKNIPTDKEGYLDTGLKWPKK